jgi:hypothetical protein
LGLFLPYEQSAFLPHIKTAIASTLLGTVWDIQFFDICILLSSPLSKEGGTTKFKKFIPK